MAKRKARSVQPKQNAESKEIRFDQKNEVRAIARERVGTVKPGRPILPKTARKKPKHKMPAGELNTELD